MTDKVCGVDVGKDELVFALTSSAKPKKVCNRGADIECLVKKIRKQCVTLVVIEATGGYERALVTSLWKAKIKVAVINPRQSRAFAKSIGLQAKTDPVDSRLLARMGESVELRCTPEPSAELLQMRALLTRRAQLIRMIAMERCHLKAPLMLGKSSTCPV